MTSYTCVNRYNVQTLLDPIKPLTVPEWVTCGFCTGDRRGVRGTDMDVGLKEMCNRHIDFCLNELGSWWGIAKVLMH